MKLSKTKSFCILNYHYVTIWNVYTNSNIPLNECVNCASLNPATTLGIADRKGSLEVGKDADVVITDAEFKVLKTIIGGEIRYEA